jgi:antitoxin HicB
MRGVEKAYTVVLSPDPNAGGYTVTCPAMPGAVSEGGTRDAALSAIAEAMALWLEVAHEHGEQPLQETPELLAAEVERIFRFRAEEGWDQLVATEVVTPSLAAAA